MNHYVNVGSPYFSGTKVKRKAQVRTSQEQKIKHKAQVPTSQEQKNKTQHASPYFSGTKKLSATRRKTVKQILSSQS